MNQNVTQSQSQSTGKESGLIASLRTRTHHALNALKPSSKLYALATAGLSLAAVSNQNLQAQEAVTLMDNTGNLAQSTTPNLGGKGNYLITTGSPSSVPVIKNKLNGIGVALTNSTASDIVLETITVNVLTQCGGSTPQWRSSEFADHIFSTSVNLIPGTPEGIAAWKARSTNAPVQTVLIPGHYTQGAAPSGQISFNSSQTEIDATTIERGDGILKITPWTLTINLDEAQKLVIPPNSVSYLNLHINTENYEGVSTTIKILDCETNRTAYFCSTTAGLTSINSDKFTDDAPGHSDMSMKVVGKTVSASIPVVEVSVFNLLIRPNGMCVHLEGTNLTPESLTKNYTILSSANLQDAPTLYAWSNFTINIVSPRVLECLPIPAGEGNAFDAQSRFFILKVN